MLALTSCGQTGTESIKAIATAVSSRRDLNKLIDFMESPHEAFPPSGVEAMQFIARRIRLAGASCLKKRHAAHAV
jgi:hypothetical protein